MPVFSVQAVVNEIRAAYGPDAAEGYVCDVADKERIKYVVEAVAKRFGGIDILYVIPKKPDGLDAAESV